MIRITADVDNSLLSSVRLRTAILIDWVEKYKGVRFNKCIVRRSSSKKGCHVILFTESKLSKIEIFFYRSLFGDDRRRLLTDFKRKKAKQYLFRKKKRIKWAVVK